MAKTWLQGVFEVQVGSADFPFVNLYRPRVDDQQQLQYVPGVVLIWRGQLLPPPYCVERSMIHSIGTLAPSAVDQLFHARCVARLHTSRVPISLATIVRET